MMQISHNGITFHCETNVIITEHGVVLSLRYKLFLLVNKGLVLFLFLCNQRIEFCSLPL